ncbi:hypothetical protein T05_4223 [Trichinella murrelli]|uniref:Uncharacterized protein n=1 Tax=Trichinella murrelli TaxID=144512 RepID=A0A0V0TQG5_9BILA|nr:hypothetical protein T05_12681 [Trichinella murrelli]KRX43155.1 hypothetical protein T05_4223 [Trichinella murrelli]
MPSCNEDCAVLRIQDQCRRNKPSRRKDCETNKNYSKSANTWETPKTMLTRSNLMVNYAKRSLAIRIRKKFPRCKDCLNN